MATTNIRLADMPFFLQKVTGAATPILYSAQNFRNYTQAYNRRSGPLGPDHFRVVQSSTVGWSAKIKAGYAGVGGIYTVRLAADTDVSVPSTWKPTSGTVSHSVCVVVYDELVAGGDSYGELQVIQDAGSGAPAPVGAAAYLPLATITVSATQSNIQDANIDNIVRHGGSAFSKVNMSNAGWLVGTYQAAPGDGHTVPYCGYDSGVVRLSGRIFWGGGNMTSGSGSQNNDLYIAQFPPEYRPLHKRSLVGTTSKNEAGTSSLYFYRAEIGSDGKFIARIPTGQAVEFITLDNMTYCIDDS